MLGKVVYRVSVPQGRCRLVKPYPSGDLIMLGDGVLTRVSWEGVVRWRVDGRYRGDRAGPQNSFHHDFAVAPDGGIMALTNNNRKITINGKSVPVRDDEITYLSARGKVLKRVSLLDILKPLISKERLARLARRKVDKSTPWDDDTDLMHVNTLELLPPGAPLGKGADVLVAARYLDLVAALDLDRGAVTWSYGPGKLQWPHHPTLLPDGKVLVFDNGSRRKASRVIILDPVTLEVVWEYRAMPGQTPFFTDSRGSAQRLPNGDMLITESETGRLFEVDSASRLVWEYWNPDLVKQGAKHEMARRLIYRATRYDPALVKDPVFLGVWKATYGS